MYLFFTNQFTVCDPQYCSDKMVVRACKQKKCLLLRAKRVIVRNVSDTAALEITSDIMSVA